MNEIARCHWEACNTCRHWITNGECPFSFERVVKAFEYRPGDVFVCTLHETEQDARDEAADAALERKRDLAREEG